VRERRIAVGLAALCLGAGVLGCGGGGDVTTIAGDDERPEASTGKPDNGRPPVGDGEGGVKLEKVGDFDQPVWVTQAPGDDHLYVVEQCGRILRVPPDGGEAGLFLDVSEQVTCGGEQGLLSVAFDPGYEKSGLLYIYFTDTGGDERIVELRRSGDGATADPGTARELVAIDDFAPNHNGGLLLFGPDGDLYAGTGDGGGAGDPERTAQDPSSPLGKLLRIDPEKGFEVAALGLRNPWRFSFDRATGDLWIGDVGQDTLEEIDAITARTLAGSEPPNFGWSAFEGTDRFNADQQAPGAIPPVYEYGRDRGCSVCVGYVVGDPDLHSLYGGDLYGVFCEGDLHSFVGRPGQRARDDRALGLRVEQLSSFGEDADGHVYAMSLGGPLYRLAPDG
jgi:glucose/arabinose dehydrogenase